MATPDKDILSQIDELVAEEHRLRSAPDVDSSALQRLEEKLDQCWDLLRQRRARREFAEDPDQAEARSTSTVEHYQQ
jgi:hypothetical protein